MMCEEMKKAILKVSKELSDMECEEFREEFERHISGDISQILLESGYIDANFSENNSDI